MNNQNPRFGTRLDSSKDQSLLILEMYSGVEEKKSAMLCLALLLIIGLLFSMSTLNNEMEKATSEMESQTNRLIEARLEHAKSAEEKHRANVAIVLVRECVAKRMPSAVGINDPAGVAAKTTRRCIDLHMAPLGG